jgi:hypothetical protein
MKIGAVDSVQSERDRRKALKVERDILFARYLTQPKNIRLAVEIKAIDDEIAKSVEDSTSAHQRSRPSDEKPGARIAL